MAQPQAPLVSTVELHANNTTPVDENPDTTSSSPSDKDAQNDALLQASRAADSENPDGGYGWVVLFACVVIAWWYISISYTWGIFQIALLRQQQQQQKQQEEGRQHISASTLAFVGSLCPSFIASLAIPNAKLVRAIGPRVTALIGMSVMGVGCILASFTTGHVGGLFVTFGVLCGVGNSMLFMVINVAPSQWFSKKRGLANGMIYAAGGLGGAVMSFVLDALIKGLGIPWAFRIQGLAMLGTGLPAAHLLRTRYPIPPTKMVEWTMFRDARFIVLFAAGAVTTFPLYVPPFFLPLYAEALSLSSDAGVSLVAGFNFASAVGRLGCGYAGDVLGSVNALLLAVTLNALTMLIIWPLSDSLGPLIPFVILNGMANGGFFAIMPTIISSIFGSARLSVAMGMIVTGWFGGYLLGPPIAGYILEATGDESSIRTYRPAIFFAGAMAAASVILAGAIRLLIDRELRKKV